MIDIKNVLEVINEIFVFPITLITFGLLIFIVEYLRKKDPDIIRSRIFLRFIEIKKAFALLTIFAFTLIVHVSLIFVPHFFSSGNEVLIGDLQRMLGLFLVIILLVFVFYIYSSIKDVKVS